MFDRETGWSLVAAVGGMAKYLHLWLAGHDAVPFSWGRLIATVLAAAFFGFIAGSFAVLTNHEHWAFVCAGLGGFLGDRTIDMIFLLVRRKP